METSETKYLAIFMDNNQNPCGILEKEIAEELIENLKRTTKVNYWTMPVSEKCARKISEQILEYRDSPHLVSVEHLTQFYRPKN